MKRFLFVIALAVSVLTASAQSYRGFIDVFGGPAMGKKTTAIAGQSHVSGIKGSFAFGLNNTHGCQITPFLYAGLGFGVNTVMLSGEQHYNEYEETKYTFYGINIPAYLDVRWDLNILKKATPFVDIKVGYQFCVNFNGMIFDSYSGDCSSLDIYGEGVPGIYFQPTVGYRFKMGKKLGFNLGISYNAGIKRKLRATTQYLDYSEGENHSTYESVELGKFTSSAVMLNLGFDF